MCYLMSLIFFSLFTVFLFYQVWSVVQKYSSYHCHILELFFCNSGSLVTNVTPDTTTLSDHSLVDIMLSYNPSGCKQQTKPTTYSNVHSFRSLDFKKGNMENLKNELKAVDWNHIRSSCTFEEFPAVLLRLFLTSAKSIFLLRSVAQVDPMP